jgi:hypothetical protein
MPQLTKREASDRSGLMLHRLRENPLADASIG